MSGLVERAMERLEAAETPPRRTPEPATPPAWRRHVLRAPSPVPLDLALGRQVVLDLGRLEAAGLLTTVGRRTPLAEEFASERRVLLERVDAVERGNMIMVTSPRFSPAKTRAAINLAMSIASERGRRVLLVDADAQSASLMKTLGVEATRGFFDVLDEPGVPFADAILRTNIGRLSLLGAGLSLSRSADLLGGEKAAEVMGELASRYTDRVVVFDAPPANETETAALGRHVGQTLVVAPLDWPAPSGGNVTVLRETATAREGGSGLRGFLRRPGSA
jgi:Mrp family chromosome partitioning ATPase